MKKRAAQCASRAIFILVLIGFIFSPLAAAVSPVRAEVLVTDQLLYGLEELKFDEGSKQSTDQTSTNVQEQTSAAVADGKAIPIPTGKDSLMGTLVGVAKGVAGTLVSGVLSFKTAMKAVVKKMIQQILLDVKSWAKKGFKGQPNFIRDWKGFLQGAALAASAEFIRNWPELAQFCSPMKITLPKKFFEAKFSEQQKVTSKFVKKGQQKSGICTIETLLTNLQGATVNYKGSLTTFATSGWNKKGGSTISAGLMHPQNNALGLFFLGQDEKMTKVAQKTATSKAQASANTGFLPLMDADGCLPKNPETGEWTCPAANAGNAVADALTEAGLGEYASMLGMKDMNDFFVGVATSAFNSMTTSISTYLRGRIGDALTEISKN
jgi:hypothetical protein